MAPEEEVVLATFVYGHLAVEIRTLVRKVRGAVRGTGEKKKRRILHSGPSDVRPHG